jgi:hypothetical protein
MTHYIGKTGLIQKVLIHKLTRLRADILAGKLVSVMERIRLTRYVRFPMSNDLLSAF